MSHHIDLIFFKVVEVKYLRKWSIVIPVTKNAISELNNFKSETWHQKYIIFGIFFQVRI